MSSTDWVNVGALSSFEMDTPKAVTIAETTIVILRLESGLYALGGKCPHKGAPMETGSLCRNAKGGPLIVCPWHKAVFDVETGRLDEPLALDDLPSYPARVEDDQVMVSLTPVSHERPEKSRTHETVLIVGAGAGGVTCAATLRREGYGGRIVMVSPEDDLPYDRTALSKLVLSSSPDSLRIPPLRPESFYEDERIERVRDAVNHVDTATRQVTLASGASMTADHVVLASGARARRPDFPGGDHARVLTLRSAEDARQIAAIAGPETSAVLIGSGFIAMEAAASLRKRGVGVTVVSQTEFPMANLLGREIGGRLRGVHEKNGVAFIPNATVTAIEEGERGLTVILDDETRTRADFVIAGIGAEPVVDFLDQSLIGEEGGLRVDHQMRVADGVYAVGDIAAVFHAGAYHRIEHWRVAQTQAQIAARAVMGLETEVLPLPWFWTQQYNQKLESLGWPGKIHNVEIEGDLSSLDFVARLFSDDEHHFVVASKEAQKVGELVIEPEPGLA